MFATSHLFSGFPPSRAPEYSNYAALAKARAAEAAAKAAEAEYYAREAALREQELRARAAFWAPSQADVPAPPFFHNQYAATPCACCAPFTKPREPLAFPHGDYYPARRPFAAEPAHGLAPYHGHHHHQHHREAPHYSHLFFVEKELEKELKQERLARFKLEQELKQKELELKARQLELGSLFGQPTAVAQNQCSRSEPSVKANDIATVACPWAWAGSVPKAKRQSAPAPQATTSEDAIQDYISNVVFQSILGNAPPARGATNDVKPQAVPRKSKDHSTEASLIDQLKARYQKEGEDEVRDTIQALFNSLLHQGHPSSSSTPQKASTSQPKATTSSSSPVNDTKGKAKETAAPSESSSSAEVLKALERVERIEHTFHNLEADFVFPPQLDFVSTTNTTTTKVEDSSAIFPHLAFTARNHPVRYYEQTLSSLLQQLDLIESHGNSSLRMKRKLTVRSIEQALEELEREVAGRWKASLAKARDAKKADEASAKDATETASPVRIPIIDSSVTTAATEATPTPATETTTSSLEIDATATTPTEQSSTTTATSDETQEDTPTTDESQVVPTQEDEARELVDIAETQSAESETESGSESQPLSDTITPSTFTNSEFALASTLPPSEESDTIESAPEVIIETQTTPTTPITNNEQLLSPATPVSTDSESVVSHPSAAPGPEEDAASDGFLLTQPRSPVVRKRKSVEIEDLGSDWSDLDA